MRFTAIHVREGNVTRSVSTR